MIEAKNLATLSISSLQNVGDRMVLRQWLFGGCIGALLVVPADADWTRFRGPGGQGVASDASVPTRWSPEANVVWKTPLPGPGVSSPIVVGDRVFVTCYSGYGLDREQPGEIENLMRHVVCIDLQTGEPIWQRDVPAEMPEDPYTGIGVTAHGYASHTPVSDGSRIFAFFGKSGVHAFDLDGNPLWQTGVGKESDPPKWGSSSSPIIYRDTVIITAAAESQSIIGLDAETGEERWRAEAEGLDNMWGTPTLMKTNAGDELVMVVGGEMWGLDPTNGKMRWYADATEATQSYTSVVHDGDVIYAFTGRGGGNVAIRPGGKGDVTDTNTVWSGTTTASFASPVRHNDRLYSIAQNVLSVVDAKTGDKLNQIRLSGARRTGGRFGSLDYPSPIVVGNRLLYLNGSGQTFVFDLDNDAKQIAINELAPSNDGDAPETFGGSPAVSDGYLLIRGSKHLYAIKDQGDPVPDPTPSDAVAQSDEGRRGGPGGGGGRGRFDPMERFKSQDKDGDGSLSMQELQGNPMADRLKTLDKDADGQITAQEYQSGIGELFRRGGRGGRGSGGRGSGGYGDKDNRPDRPQRPSMVD